MRKLRTGEVEMNHPGGRADAPDKLSGGRCSIRAPDEVPRRVRKLRTGEVGINQPGAREPATSVIAEKRLSTIGRSMPRVMNTRRVERS